MYPKRAVDNFWFSYVASKWDKNPLSCWKIGQNAKFVIFYTTFDSWVRRHAKSHRIHFYVTISRVSTSKISLPRTLRFFFGIACSDKTTRLTKPEWPMKMKNERGARHYPAYTRFLRQNAKRSIYLSKVKGTCSM